MNYHQAYEIKTFSLIRDAVHKVEFALSEAIPNTGDIFRDDDCASTKEVMKILENDYFYKAEVVWKKQHPEKDFVDGMLYLTPKQKKQKFIINSL